MTIRLALLAILAAGPAFAQVSPALKTYHCEEPGNPGYSYLIEFDAGTVYKLTEPSGSSEGIWAVGPDGSITFTGGGLDEATATFELDTLVIPTLDADVIFVCTAT
ncbi:hypothetical protein [Tabrizicola sp.]|uniref:hypothetical protein n=1 Tax=Tabrizicola sp. TaxID=2005166 RepID=UPI003F3DA797